MFANPEPTSKETNTWNELTQLLGSMQMQASHAYTGCMHDGCCIFELRMILSGNFLKKFREFPCKHPRGKMCFTFSARATPDFHKSFLAVFSGLHGVCRVTKGAHSTFIVGEIELL